jgi:hypothetical protein
MQSLIPFKGDHLAMIPWNAFTNTSANVLRRLYMKVLPDDSWRMGVCYDYFKEIQLTDLTDTKHVGELRAKQVIEELKHAFSLLETGHEFKRNDALIADLISYNGDDDIAVLWENFTTPVSNSLHRMLMRVALDDTWNLGLKYSHLAGLHLSDITDTLEVGSGKTMSIIEELHRVFTSLETEGEGSSVSTLSDLEDLPYFGALDEATNFEELVSGIYFILDASFPIDDRGNAILRARLPLFLEEPKTLDELGAEWGVTRERIRQIEVKYTSLEIQNVEAGSTVVPLLVECLEGSDSEEEFIHRAKELDLVGSINLTVMKLYAAAEILCMHDLRERVSHVIDRWYEAVLSEDALVDAAQKYRTKLGLLDLELFASESQVTSDEAFAAVRQAYPRSIRSGSLALARTAKLDTTFQNILGKQLLVFETLSAEDLLIGIERHANYRNYSVIGAHKDQIGLIVALSGEAPNFETYKSDCTEIPSLNETDNWLLEIFRNSPSGMLHRNEVTAAALRDHKNVATMSIFLLFNPLLRTVGPGVMALADMKIDSVSANQYAKIARAAEERTELDWSFEGTDISITFCPNLNAMSAGVLFPNPELRNMIKAFVFNVACDCGKLQSEQQLKLKDPSFWTGFSATIKHMTDFHHFTKGDDITMHLNFDTKLASIKPLL